MSALDFIVQQKVRSPSSLANFDARRILHEPTNTFLWITKLPWTGGWPPARPSELPKLPLRKTTTRTERHKAPKSTPGSHCRF